MSDVPRCSHDDEIEIPNETTMTTKGRWVIDIYRAALKAGKSREEARREVNAMLYPAHTDGE